MFWRNVLPPSSDPKNKPSKKPAGPVSEDANCLPVAGFLLGSLVEPECGGGMLLRNIGTAQHHNPEEMNTLFEVLHFCRFLFIEGARITQLV
jgi:hypothetical protein